MSIEEIRAIQKNKQVSAIGQRRSAESITRIGDRDPLTGRFQVLDSDGGVSPQGVKVYNAQEQYGDRVLPFPRTDGTIALDSEKGSIIKPPTAFPHCPGYLYGQVFNCEVPKKKKPGKIWILYAYQGRFYVGGHQRDGVLVYDPIPPNMPLFDPASPALSSQFPIEVRENYSAVWDSGGSIWGDSEGWEASFKVRHATPEMSNAPAPARPGTGIYCFIAESLEEKRYSKYYVGKFLGKGLFQNELELTTTGGLSNGYGTEVKSWKTAITDHNGEKISSTGSSVMSVTRISSGPYNGQRRSLSSSFSYPDPNSMKNENYSFSDSSYLGPIPSSGSNSSSNSWSIIFRDRSSSIFFKGSTSWSAGSFSTNLLGGSYILNDGRKDSLLFSVPDGSRPSPESIGPWDYSDKLFGEQGGTTGVKSKRRYKYSNPSITIVDVDDCARLSNFYNSQKSCKTKIYNIFSFDSMASGIHQEVEVDAWGIPSGSYVVDACAWVP